MQSILRNSVQLQGNMGTDVQITTFENGNKVAKIAIATNSFYTDKSGNKAKNTDWHNAVAYGKLADELLLSAKKGMEIAIQGKLSTRSYTDKLGMRKFITEIVMNEFSTISKKTTPATEAVPF